MSDLFAEIERLKRKTLCGKDGTEDLSQQAQKHVRLDATKTKDNSGVMGGKKPFWVKDPASKLSSSSGTVKPKHSVDTPVKPAGSTESKAETSRQTQVSSAQQESIATSKVQNATVTDVDDAAASKAKIAEGELDTITEGISALRVKRLLRQLGEPITLFGESDAERIERLKAVQLRKQDLAHSATGQKNIMDDIKLRIEHELQRSTVETQGAAVGLIGDEQVDNADPDDLAERRRKLERAKEEEDAKRFERDLPRSEFSTSANYVRFSLKRWLWVWNNHLKRRDPVEASSPQGRYASELYAQTGEYLKPLLKDLKDGTVEPDIVDMLEKIVELTQQREYRQANQYFLDLAIGDSPWPIGVTMVGIHERSSREKISTSKVAHILNDEKKRKYIQAVKRILMFCQSMYPTDPSKMFAS